MGEEGNMRDKVTGCYRFWRQVVDNFQLEADSPIRLLPEMFALLTDLLNMIQIDKDDRRWICAALAYLAAPGDWIPEALHGPRGYIDDIYLCAYVVDRLVKKYGIEPIRGLWEGPANLEEILARVLKESGAVIEKHDLQKKIFQYVGLE